MPCSAWCPALLDGESGEWYSSDCKMSLLLHELSKDFVTTSVATERLKLFGVLNKA